MNIHAATDIEVLVSRYRRHVDWWNEFWAWANENQLAATVVGGVLVVLGLKALSYLPRIGSPLATAFTFIGFILGIVFGWLWTWHPVSARRHERDLEAMVARMSAVNIDNLKRHEANKQTLDEAVKVYAKQLMKLESQSLRPTDTQTPATPMNPPPPLPIPRWSIYAAGEEGDGNDFVLKNLMPRSVAKEVHLEGDLDFALLDAGHWESLTGIAAGEFRGELNARGWALGVRFTVEWYNEKNEHRTASVSLQGHPEDIPAYEEMSGEPL
jgi:hypothetical protein